jgi:hypothetical protein
MVQFFARAAARPFVALFSGFSTAWDILVIALVIADAKTDPERKQFVEEGHVKALLAVPTKAKARTVDPIARSVSNAGPPRRNL